MTTLADKEKAHAGRPVTWDTIHKQFNWRYATKKFDPSKKLAAEDVAALEQAITLAPSSYGLQPWKFVFVTDPGIRAKLRQAAYNQTQVVEASHLVVLAARRGIGPADVQRFIDRVAAVHRAPVDAFDGYKQMMLGFVNNHPREWLDAWTTKQVGIALGFLLSTAALLGIDACPMEGFEPPKFDEILGLDKNGYGSVALCALGYRADDDKQAGHAKVRFPVDEVIERI